MHACKLVCMRACMYACMCLCLCAGACACVYSCACVSVCVCACAYVYLCARACACQSQNLPRARVDFLEGDEDSNFSLFRVRRFTEWTGSLHWIAFPVEILTKPPIHWIAFPLFTETPLFFTEKCFVASPSQKSALREPNTLKLQHFWHYPCLKHLLLKSLRFKHPRVCVLGGNRPCHPPKVAQACATLLTPFTFLMRWMCSSMRFGIFSGQKSDYTIRPEMITIKTIFWNNPVRSPEKLQEFFDLEDFSGLAIASLPDSFGSPE